jgi:hypothetical protein
LKFWVSAFRWVSGTGRSVEVLGLGIQVGQYIQLRFWAEPSGGPLRQGVQLKLWGSVFRWVSEQGVHLKFWGCVFRWVSEQSVQLKVWGKAFRWVIVTGYSVEVVTGSGCSVDFLGKVFRCFGPIGSHYLWLGSGSRF